MPVQSCVEDGKSGRRWGESGKCYPCEEGDCSDAQRKAEAQGRAIEAQALKERLFGQVKKHR